MINFLLKFKGGGREKQGFVFFGMAIFMCQFDWATGCLMMWSNVLGVSVRMLLDESNI